MNHDNHWAIVFMYWGTEKKVNKNLIRLELGKFGNHFMDLLGFTENDIFQ